MRTLQPKKLEETHIIEHGRFKDAPWYALAQQSKIVIGGAGGIGSWLTLLLARTGIKCYVFDDDTLEQHNLAGQLYSIKHVTMPKVHALKELLNDYAPASSIMPLKFKVDEKTKVGLMAASAFDNMLARKYLFEAWVQANVYEGVIKEGAMFIDGRLEAESMMIFCVRNEEDIEKYKEELKLTDADIEEASCTFKQTSYGAAMIASHMTGFVINHLSNIATKRTSRKVPYQWEYFIPLNS